MEYLNSYSYFILDQVINEMVDYEWNVETGEEIDHRTGEVFKNKIQHSFKHAINKLEWYDNLLQKIRNWHPKFKKAILSLAVVMAVTYVSADQLVDTTSVVDASVVPDVEEIIKKTTTEVEKSKEKVIHPSDREDNIVPEFTSSAEDAYLVGEKDASKFSISNKGLELIKNEEKLRLTAYALGDGHITIGYGHAKPISRSKYKVGDEISVKQSNRLFRKDIKDAEGGVKRIFKKWKKGHLNVKINQNQFDALVSLAYNMGVGGLMKSETINLIKSGQMEEAGEKIKDEITKNQRDKFPGLITRRAKESNLFMGITETRKADISPI